MPRLIRIDSGAELGTIDDKQVAFLVEQLDEDDDNETEYFIDRETLELLSDNGADPDLLALLEKGMGDDDEMDIGWE
jgi:hypothetical protein